MRLVKEKFDSQMILQVHDELLFEAPKNEIKDLVRVVTQEMQGAVSFKVPIKVSVKVGPNWLDMEDFG